MPSLGPPNRGNDPLHVFTMAGALIVAAIAGAALGFLLDFGFGGSSDAPTAAQTEVSAP